jgi:hypothetical protein
MSKTDRSETAAPAAGSPLDCGVRPRCSHCGFPLPASGGGLRHYGTHTAHQESECLQLLHAEIARLTTCLKAANDQAEHFERVWYLRGYENERLRETLNFIATHFSSDWPERCQSNVLAARHALTERPNDRIQPRR